MFTKIKSSLWVVSVWCLIFAGDHAIAGVNVLTYHNDISRTGQNTNETYLTPAIVASTNFGKVYGLPVDGYVYAQPLLVTNLTIPSQGVHDVLYVVTEHDSVYAFDANTNTPPLWHVSFTNPAAGISSVTSGDVGCTDMPPETGITGTPVIDPVTQTIYLVAKLKQVTNGVMTFMHRLYALDLTTGALKFGSPTLINPTVAGNGDGNDGAGHVPFDAQTEMNRAALLLNNGIVYVATASHCDNGPYHGWLMGYGAQTLALSNVYNATPNGGLGGFWQAGGGQACDTNGNMYLMSGNGTFNPAANCYGESFLKFSATNGLQMIDYFTPYNQSNLTAGDQDLGSGGPLLLPDVVGGGTTNNQHLIVGAGKQGTVYLLSRDGLGQYNGSNDNQIVQPLPGAIGGSFDTPAYFNKTIYYNGAGDVLKAFAISNAHINPTPISQAASGYGFPGATPSISANGTSNAIVWALQTDGYGNSNPTILHAYNATNLSVQLYSSSAAGTRDLPGGAVKFTVPTVANGKVYIGTQYEVDVYGTGVFLLTPVISPAASNFTNSVSISISDASPGTTIYYTLDGSNPTTNSTFYGGSFVLTNSALVKARAFKVGTSDSGMAMATYVNIASIGTGIGLTGCYYSNQLRTFVNPPTLVRTDATVNFNWGTGSPDPSISTDDFTAIWTGAVQPVFSQTYTFYTSTDDGTRLWVNGQLLIDKWVDQGPTEWSGTIPLNGGQKYPITMEYYENGGGAAAQLSWSSPSTTKAIIPQSQLYPFYPPQFTLMPGAFANGNFVMQLNGLNGKGYVLQTSTNLSTWVSIQTNLPNSNPNVALPNNVFYFTNAVGTNFPARFYRAVQQP